VLHTATLVAGFVYITVVYCLLSFVTFVLSAMIDSFLLFRVRLFFVCAFHFSLTSRFIPIYLASLTNGIGCPFISS
jgi:hypothetical protein